MAIDKECKATIWRYHFVEHWGVNTIASQWGIHHSTVDRVLSPAGLPKVERAISPSMIDPYVPFMLKTLEQYPTLTAARLYDMALERGCTGGVSHFRARVAQRRPRPVERSIRTLRSSFFAGRQWRDIDDLNAQADAWCRGQSANRPCPEDTSMTVREAFAQEQPQLLALPDNPFPTDERIEVSAGKTPYVRCDFWRMPLRGASRYWNWPCNVATGPPRWLTCSRRCSMITVPMN